MTSRARASVSIRDMTSSARFWTSWVFGGGTGVEEAVRRAMTSSARLLSSDGSEGIDPVLAVVSDMVGFGDGEVAVREVGGVLLSPRVIELEAEEVDGE